VQDVFRRSRASGTRLAVLLALAEMVNESAYTATREAVAWPSHETLALRVNVKGRAIRYAIEGLVNDGELRRTGRVRASGCVVYEITLPADEKALPDQVHESAPRQEDASGEARSCLRPRQGLADEPEGTRKEPGRRRRAATATSFTDKGNGLDLDRRGKDDYEPDDLTALVRRRVAV